MHRIARLFHELRQGYELLLDPLRRMALDAKLRLASAKKERYKEYDSKRKAMVADLEEREAAFKRARTEKDREERARWTDNQRIKEEGRKMREDRQNRTQEADQAKKPETLADELADDEPPDLGVWIALFANVYDTATVVFSMKSSKKAPSKPPKYATALAPFTSIGAAFAAVEASGRADRGLEGVEVSWAGGPEPPLIGWLKKKGMLGSGEVKTSAKGKPLPPTSASTSSVDGGDSFSSFPTSFVSLTPFFFCLRDVDVSALQPEASTPASIPGVDFESLTLMRMRQAERERLEHEIMEKEAVDV